MNIHTNFLHPIEILVYVDVVAYMPCQPTISILFISTTCKAVAIYFRILVEEIALAFSSFTLLHAFQIASFPRRLLHDLPLFTGKTYWLSSTTSAFFLICLSVSNSMAFLRSGVTITGTLQLRFPRISTMSNI